MSVACLICKSHVDDEVYYGKFMNTENIHVHYYCLLLCSNLIQNGEDNEGILGFLANDIRKEAKRISKRICCYCRGKSAAIGCCHSQCIRSFHLPCGIKNNCQSLFKGTYQSFCHRHTKVKSNDKHKRDEKCCICLENMGKYNPLTSICTPCCHNGFFHKSCIAKSALVAGYFFKCPLCNNNSGKFKSYMSSMGIFIPEQDAAWELEPNAYSELLERPNHCEADFCLCTNGKKYSDNDWSFTYCWACGSKGIHEKCLQRFYKTIFLCKICETLNAKHLNTDTDTESELVNIVDLSSTSDEENIESVRRSNTDEDSSEDEHPLSTRLKMIKPKEEQSESCFSDDAIAHEKSRSRSQPLEGDEESDETVPDASEKSHDTNEFYKEDKYTIPFELRSNSDKEAIETVRSSSSDEDSSEDEYNRITRSRSRISIPKKVKVVNSESCSSDSTIVYKKTRRITRLDLSSSDEEDIERVGSSNTDGDSSVKMITPKIEKSESCFPDGVPNGTIVYKASSRKSQLLKEAEIENSEPCSFDHIIAYEKLRKQYLMKENEVSDKTVSDVSKKSNHKNIGDNEDERTSRLILSSSSDEEDTGSVRSSSAGEDSSKDEYIRITRSRAKIIIPKEAKMIIPKKAKIENSEPCSFDHIIAYEKLWKQSLMKENEESNKTLTDVCLISDEEHEVANGVSDVILIEENITLTNTVKSSSDITFSLDQILTNRLTDGGNFTDSETHITSLQRKSLGFSTNSQNTISSNSDLANSKVSNRSVNAPRARAIPSLPRLVTRSESERSDISSVCLSSQDTKTVHEPDENFCECKEENNEGIMTIKETELTVPKVELIFEPILEPTQHEVLDIISSSTGMKRKFESEIIIISSDSEKSPKKKRRKIMKKSSDRNTNIWSKTGNKTTINRRVPTKKLSPEQNCKNQSVITLYLSPSGSPNALSSTENSPTAIESVTKKCIPKIQFSNSPSSYDQTEHKGSILHYFKKG